MKLLVVSDNHRDRDVLEWVKTAEPDINHLIHLGDSEMSESELTELGFYGVRGNYPFEPKFPNDLIMEYNRVKLLLTHGHKYGVKLGIYGLVEAALSLSVQVVFYGHTHMPKINEFENILFINPGTISKSRGSYASFAVVEILEHRITIQIRETYTNKVLSEYQRLLDVR